MNEHRYDMSQLEKEEAAMEAEDELDAKFDEQKRLYVLYLLNGSVRSPKFKSQIISNFEYFVWRDWFDSLDNMVMELVRLNLACGDREKAGMVLVESLEEYMDEIAANAVRDDNKRG